jgi:chromosome segregation ATPase
MMVTAGGATAGMAGRVGRASVGRLAYNASESDGLKDAAAKGGVGGWAARIALKSARYTGDASFDARKVAGLGKATGLGEGAKGGFKTILSDVKKKEEAFAKSLGEVEDTDTKVAEFMAEKEALTNDLKVAKKKKALAGTRAEKQKAQEEIEEFEKKIKEQEEIIKQEKARRQIGSYVDASTHSSTKVAYSEAQDAKKKADKEITALSQRIRETKKMIKEDTSLTSEMKKGLEGDMEKDTVKFKKAAKTLKEQNKIIKDLKHEAKKNSGKIGYAGVLEESSHMASWATGRLKAHDKAAGKSVRKQFSKGHAKDEAHKHEEKHDKKGDDHAPKADGAATAKPH